MSKLTDKLREKGVYNIHDFYGYGQPFIVYYPSTSGRAGQSARWKVFKIGTSLSETWYDYGAKTFLKWGDKKKAFAEAQAYATEKFGIKEFARDPFGGYGDAEYVKARLKELCTENG